jgi:hypothetical protein
MARSRSVYFSPDWLDEPKLAKRNTNTWKTLRILRDAFPNGCSIRDISSALNLKASQVKNALNGLQTGRRVCILVRRSNLKANVQFTSDRILHHLRWGEDERAMRTLDWMLQQYAWSADLSHEVVRDIINSIQDEGFSIDGVTFTQQDQERVAEGSAIVLNQLFENHDLNTKAKVEANAVWIKDGADVISLDSYRNKRALELLGGSHTERLQALLMVLTGLRRKKSS